MLYSLQQLSWSKLKPQAATWQWVVNINKTAYLLPGLFLRDFSFWVNRIYLAWFAARPSHQIPDHVQIPICGCFRQRKHVGYGRGEILWLQPYVSSTQLTLFYNDTSMIAQPSFSAAIARHNNKKVLWCCAMWIFFCTIVDLVCGLM